MTDPISSNEIVRQLRARSPLHMFLSDCLDLRAADEIERLCEEVAVLNEVSRAAHIAMVKTWSAHEPEAAPYAWFKPAGDGTVQFTTLRSKVIGDACVWRPLYRHAQPPPEATACEFSDSGLHKCMDCDASGWPAGDELERYKQALHIANGRLIAYDIEPVKLEYSTPTKPEVHS